MISSDLIRTVDEAACLDFLARLARFKSYSNTPGEMHTLIQTENCCPRSNLRDRHIILWLVADKLAGMLDIPAHAAVV